MVTNKNKTGNTSAREIIRAMLFRRNVSISKLAECLNKMFGYSFSQSNLSRKLISNTVKWSELQDIAKILGYKIRFMELDDWEGLDFSKELNNSAANLQKNTML